MARAEKTGRKLGDVIERVATQPTFTVEDWAVLNNVSRNTGYAEAVASNIEGAYRVGAQYRIASAPWRAKLGLKAPAAALQPAKAA